MTKFNTWEQLPSLDELSKMTSPCGPAATLMARGNGVFSLDVESCGSAAVAALSGLYYRDEAAYIEYAIVRERDANLDKQRLAELSEWFSRVAVAEAKAERARRIEFVLRALWYFVSGFVAGGTVMLLVEGLQ